MSRIRKYVKYIILFVALSIALISPRTMSIATSTNTTVYERSDENFSNPERGFFVRFHPIGNEPVSPLQFSDLQKVRSQNMTLIRRIYLIAEFRDKPFSQSFLDLISNDFNTAREAGLKMILRFSYNWLGGGPDAPLTTILSHLEQLKPVFENNYDVIAYLEAGFIGNWGEWNKSSNNLREDPAARKAVLFKALSVLPSERMVALRYPYYKRDAFNNENPLTDEEAFDGSYRARTGAHNECFLVNSTDAGTYNSTSLSDIDKQKAFLNLDNQYVAQGGELCLFEDYDDTNQQQQCPNALNELARMRWSALNFNPSDGWEIIQGWGKQGCLEEIKRRLGYRFRMIKSLIPSSVKPGGTFSMSFEIANDGFASPYNPRKLEIILRHLQTQEKYYLPVKEDARMWMPETTKTVNIVGGVPANMPEGEYQVLLNLPDPAPSLYQRPEYSIRLANQDIWEDSTGYNSLLKSVIVDSSAEGVDYSGDQLLKPLK